MRGVQQVACMLQCWGGGIILMFEKDLVRIQ